MTPSSGNVFRDLGFDEAEAEHLRVRSTLMIAVRKVIEDRGLTQVDAAKLFGVRQPRISNILGGRIDLFSIDTLVDMLARAGIHVDLVVYALRQGGAILVSRDPEIMSGNLCFTGTRVPVQNLFDYLEDNSSLDEFLEDFPSVGREKAEAVLKAARADETAERPLGGGVQ